jgi:hypothetical protein
MTTYVSFGQNFGTTTADPEVVTTGTTQTPTYDVVVWVNTTNMASPDGSSGGADSVGRSEVRRIVENILNYISDGRQAVLPGV